MFEKITPANWLMFAMHNYDNPQGEGEEEFHEDIKRFKYLKRLLKKYHETGNLKERLILNHIIILSNVFGNLIFQTFNLSLIFLKNSKF